VGYPFSGKIEYAYPFQGNFEAIQEKFFTRLKELVLTERERNPEARLLLNRGSRIFLSQQGDRMVFNNYGYRRFRNSRGYFTICKSEKEVTISCHFKIDHLGAILFMLLFILMSIVGGTSAFGGSAVGKSIFTCAGLGLFFVIFFLLGFKKEENFLSSLIKKGWEKANKSEK